MPETEKHNVTLESLLRLKRSERPTAEFWDGFDREWNNRRLRALIPPEPWYMRWRGPALRLATVSAPLGAAAAVVLWLQTLPPPTQSLAQPALAALPQAKGLGANAVRGTEVRAAQVQVEPSPAMAEAISLIFVEDSIAPDASRVAYAKVLARSDLQFEGGSGGRYVSDGLVATATFGALLPVEF